MVYCRNNQCPFKDCDKHISKAKNLYEVYVANFDGVCRRYISWLLDEIDKENYIMSEKCGNCRYCRIDKDTNIPYCKKTYTDVNLDSKACDRFEDDDY